MNPSPGPWMWQRDLGQERNLMDAACRCVLVSNPSPEHDDAALIASAPEMRDLLLRLEYSSNVGALAICAACAAPEGLPHETEPFTHAPCSVGAVLERIR